MSDDESYATDGEDGDVSTTDSNPISQSHDGAGSPYKVLGEHDAPTGTGVLGHNTATSGTAVGVEGVTDSSDDAAAGVVGVGNREGANGVAGYTLADSTNEFETSTSTAILGNTDRVPGPAIYGVHSADSGTAAGVAGDTYSPDGAGVWGFNFGNGPGVRSHSFLQVDGHVEVADLGVSAYLDTSQSIAEGSATTVVFTAREVDDRGEYDSETGVFTCANDGAYHVDTQISYKFGGEDPLDGRYDLEVTVNSNPVLRDSVYYPGSSTAPNAAYVTLSGSKTLRNLSANHEIRVEAALYGTGTARDLYPKKHDTYLTISQVG